MKDMCFTRSSRKPWPLLQRLDGANRINKDHPNMEPDKISSRIVATSKSPIDKPFSRSIRKEINDLKSNLTETSEYVQPCTEEEITVAISLMKRGNATGVDQIYPEFISTLVPKPEPDYQDSFEYY